MKHCRFIAVIILVCGFGIQLSAQSQDWPSAPEFKGYKDKPGKVVKYNSLNYIDILGEEGQQLRQAMGKYWEVNFSYDSVFRQKRKFKDFMINQVLERRGALFFQDTMQIHFVVPEEGGNVWGRIVLTSDKQYRLRLIKEGPFDNSLLFDVKPDVKFDQFVDPTELPARLNYLPRSIITRAQFSKFNHVEFTWNVKDTIYTQKVMGPYWDLKLEVKNPQGEIDRTMSTVEIMESYYRACQKVGGVVIKSRPRELILILPLEKASLWVRVTASLDGVYFIRAVQVDDKDKSQPSKKVLPPAPVQDSTIVNDSSIK
jgi:hypothetical protein